MSEKRINSKKVLGINDFQETVTKVYNESQLQSNYIMEAMVNQFESYDRLMQALNYYVNKTIDDHCSWSTIEEAIIILAGCCEFISASMFQQIFRNNTDAKKCIDGMKRLVKKGYICKTSKRDENGKAFYCLTENGTKEFERLVEDYRRIPFSEHSYQQQESVNHDANVGFIFLRFLLLKKTFKFTRNYGNKERYDIYPDAIITLLPESINECSFFIEVEKGTESVDGLIEKIGKYYVNNLCAMDKNNYVFFTYKKNNKTFFKNIFPCLDKKHIERVSRLLQLYDYTLDELINFLGNCINKDQTTKNMNMPILSEEIYRQITNEDSGHFFDYKITQVLLCAKSIKLILTFGWLPQIIPDIDKMQADIENVKLLCEYLVRNKYCNKIQYYLYCFKNIEDSKLRKIRIVKGIINRYESNNDVGNMLDALNGINEGVETLFVPNCISDAYIKFCMKMEEDDIFHNNIKKKLEAKFGHNMMYASVGAPYKTLNSVMSDLQMKNCYYYKDNTNKLIEIYVENLSISLSAMVRVITLSNELMGVSLEDRNCTIVCLVDCEREMQLFNQLLLDVNLKVNNRTRFKLPIYYLFYDDLKKEEKLAECFIKAFDEQ